MSSETETRGEGRSGRIWRACYTDAGTFRPSAEAAPWTVPPWAPHTEHQAQGPPRPAAGQVGRATSSAQAARGDRVGEQGNQSACRAVGTGSPPGVCAEPEALAGPSGIGHRRGTCRPRPLPPPLGDPGSWCRTAEPRADSSSREASIRTAPAGSGASRGPMESGVRASRPGLPQGAARPAHLAGALGAAVHHPGLILGKEPAILPAGGHVPGLGGPADELPEKLVVV